MKDNGGNSMENILLKKVASSITPSRFPNSFPILILQQPNMRNLSGTQREGRRQATCERSTMQVRSGKDRKRIIDQPVTALFQFKILETLQ